MAGYNPAKWAPTSTLRARTFDEWLELQNQYWRTLPWKTRFWMNIRYVFPKFHIDYNEFFRWVEKIDATTHDTRI